MADQLLESPKNPHFFQPLLPGFHSHLKIPLKFFSQHIQGRNEGNTVELRSDASEKTWKVHMDGRRLTVGWKEFASAHDYRIGDIIIFRQEGDFVFHVTGFGPSCCEIQYPEDKNRNMSMEQTEPESSSVDSCFVVRITDSNLGEDRLNFRKNFVCSRGSKEIVLMDEGGRTWTLDLRFKESGGIFYMRSGWRSFCNENGLKPGDTVTFKQARNNTKTPLLRFSTLESKCGSAKHSSKEKRKETGESSQRVFSSSRSGNRFVTLTVTPASLEYCRLYLPLSFVRNNKMETAGGKKITLLDKHGVKWPVNLLTFKGGERMHLGLGVKQFLEATGVKANESFMLELDWEEDTTTPIFKFCSRI